MRAASGPARTCSSRASSSRSGSCGWPSSPRGQAPERGAVLEAITLRDLRRVLPHALADRLSLRHVEARHLALVADQCRDLPVDESADVHDDVGFVAPPVPELTDLVRLEAFPGDVLGEVQVV